MELKDIKRVGIVGAGTMGAGIAQVFAIKGFEVWLYDLDEVVLAGTRIRMEKALDRMVLKGKLTQEQAKEIINSRVTMTNSLTSLEDAEMDFVIEAVPENLKLKKHIFTQLNAITRPEVILATNTSSLSLVEIAMTSGRPSNVVGMHFMNPATVMKLVEIVESPITNPWTIKLTKELAEKLGKIPVVVYDSPAFVVNRILISMLNEAIQVYEEEVATMKDIDKAMKLGAGFPMGPFELADFIGLDIVLAITKEVQRRTGDLKYAPATLLEKKVALRELGKKTGKGFYDYKVKK